VTFSVHGFTTLTPAGDSTTPKLAIADWNDHRRPKKETYMRVLFALFAAAVLMAGCNKNQPQDTATPPADTTSPGATTEPTPSPPPAQDTTPPSDTTTPPSDTTTPPADQQQQPSTTP
jgi:hypothetical protein